MTNLDRDPTDEELMTAYGAGDLAAFAPLFERYRAPLFTFLLHQVRTRSIAEDLFQDVFLRVIRSRTRYQAKGTFRSWLFTIARNVLTDDRRRTALRDSKATQSPEPNHTAMEENRPSLDQSLRADEATSDPVSLSHAEELRESIESALLELPQEQREVFLLRERAGLDFRAIAKLTDSALGTVKSRMRYALAGLRSRLSTQFDAPSEALHE